MDCVHEAHNSELCQTVGDHLDDSISYDRAHVINYMLTECSEKNVKDTKYQLVGWSFSNIDQFTREKTI